MLINMQFIGDTDSDNELGKMVISRLDVNYVMLTDNDRW